MPEQYDRRRAARIRAVAELIERYFAQFGQELAATREAFLKRIEHVFASPPPDARTGNVSPGMPPDPN
jgi:ribosomal protein S12 methylthiotransferase accessory factor YcaO